MKSSDFILLSLGLLLFFYLSRFVLEFLFGIYFIPELYNVINSNQIFVSFGFYLIILLIFPYKKPIFVSIYLAIALFLSFIYSFGNPNKYSDLLYENKKENIVLVKYYIAGYPIETNYILGHSNGILVTRKLFIDHQDIELISSSDGNYVFYDKIRKDTFQLKYEK